MGAEGEAGEVTGKIKGWLGDIMYGRTEHPWGVVIPEKKQ
jgi:branched-chain amino acid aminotransferase